MVNGEFSHLAERIWKLPEVRLNIATHLENRHLTHFILVAKEGFETGIKVLYNENHMKAYRRMLSTGPSIGRLEDYCRQVRTLNIEHELDEAGFDNDLTTVVRIFPRVRTIWTDSETIELDLEADPPRIWIGQWWCAGGVLELDLSTVSSRPFKIPERWDVNVFADLRVSLPDDPANIPVSPNPDGAAARHIYRELTRPHLRITIIDFAETFSCQTWLKIASLKRRSPDSDVNDVAQSVVSETNQISIRLPSLTMDDLDKLLAAFLNPPQVRKTNLRSLQICPSLNDFKSCEVSLSLLLQFEPEFWVRFRGLDCLSLPLTIAKISAEAPESTFDDWKPLDLDEFTIYVIHGSRTEFSKFQANLPSIQDLARAMLRIGGIGCQYNLRFTPDDQKEDEQSHAITAWLRKEIARQVQGKEKSYQI